MQYQEQKKQHNKIQKQKKQYYWLYLGWHASSELFKVGISSKVPKRNDELSIEPIYKIKFKNKQEAKDAEQKIKDKYKDFRVSIQDARKLNVAKNGCSEYFTFTKEQGMYAMDWSNNSAESDNFLSPFSTFWIDHVYPSKVPFLKTVDNLQSIPNTRDSVIDQPHLINLTNAIQLDGEVSNPIILNRNNYVMVGKHRSEVAQNLNMPYIKAVICDELYIGLKEELDISVLTNTSSFHSVNRLISKADIRKDIRNCIVEYKEKTFCSLEESVVHFSSEKYQQQLKEKYHLPIRDCNIQLAKVFLTLEEDNAVKQGQYIPYAALNNDSLLEAAIAYHNDRACIIHNDKINDLVGAIIREMHDQGKSKGLVLTYKSYQNRNTTNSTNLIYLASLKEQFGIDIAIQEIPQTEKPFNAEEMVNEVELVVM